MERRRSTNRPRRSRPSLIPFLGILAMMALLGAGLVAYQVMLPIFTMTGQVIPRAATISRSASAPAPSLSPNQPGAAAQANRVANQVSNRPAATPGLPNQHRINVLLLGSDNDSKFQSGALLTQSMIVVTIDPTTKRVGMLSIPRDFWVQIPGYGFGKIDTAYELGGVALARRTVEQDFGIPIDNYAWVGLGGFIKVVDEMGGVTLDVTHPVVDDAYPDDISGMDKYAYMRLYILAGPQHLTGSEALEYVRSRHGDLVGDFGRSARQQQVLLTLRQHAEQPGVITKVPAMMHDLQNSVRTDFTAMDILGYVNFARQIPRGNIRQIVLSPPDYSTNGTSPDGQQYVVYPQWTAIDAAVAQLFDLATTPTTASRGGAVQAVGAGHGAAPTTQAGSHTGRRVTRPTPIPVLPTPTVTPRPTLQLADVTVQVLNGTMVSGLGGRASSFLQRNGFRTTAPMNANRMNYQQTIVYNHDPASREIALSVGRLIGAAVVQAAPWGRNGGPAIVVILGADSSRRF